MKWLFATADAWPITNGTALRVWHLCRSLRSLGDEVAVLSDVEDDDFQSGYEQAGVSVFQVDPGTNARRSCWDPFEERPAIASGLAARSGQFDVVVLSAASSLQYARAVARETPVVADMIDDPMLETRRRLWRGIHPMRWMRQMRLLVELRCYERATARAAKAVFFVSDADRESFCRRNTAPKAFTSPNGVDLEYWSSVADSPADPHATDVVFVGNLSFYPNWLASEMLVKQVAPHVWRRHPKTRFRVVGPDPAPELARLAGPLVEITGRVPDVRPYLKSAAAVCTPMTAGTGIKNKLLEAWAAARAVVATPLACQGLPAIHDNNALIAAKPAGLAEQICRLLEDAELRRRIGAAGRQTVQNHFSWDKIARAFRSTVAEAYGFGRR